MAAASSRATAAPRELVSDDPAAEPYAWRRGELPPLHEAARKGNAPAVAALLRGGVSAGAASDKGDTALHWAAIGGHVAVMEDLIAAGAGWAVECHWNKFRTATRPLHWAARGGQVPAIQVLLVAGANVHAQDTTGSTALHMAGDSGSAEAVDALLAAGADVHGKNIRGSTALHWAGHSGRAEAVDALLAAGANVHAKDNGGSTALHTAGGSGRAEAVGALLTAGADVPTKNIGGWTALHKAGGSGSAEAVDALLEAGADVHAKDNDGSIALHKACQNGHTQAAESMAAARADLNATDNDGWTSLHFAVSRGHTHTVAALLRLGADPTPVCCTGETPLCIAVMLGHRKIINLLPPTHPTNAVSTPALEAVKRQRVDLLDNDRVRPSLHDPDRTSRDRVLHVAARRADVTTVGALLHRHVDVRSVNIADETPLASAISWYAKKLSAARDLAGIMVGRPDLHLRAVAEGRRPPPPRRDGLAPGAVSEAMHRQLHEWRLVMVMLLHAGAVTTGLCQSSVTLCARVVASFPSLGPQQAVRLLCTRRLTSKAKAGDAEVLEEL